MADKGGGGTLNVERIGRLGGMPFSRIDIETESRAPLKRRNGIVHDVRCTMHDARCTTLSTR